MLKKILITGGNGQLGKALSLELFDKFELLSTSKKFDKKQKTYNTMRMDIQDRDQVFNIINIFKPDVIINCAAYSNVDKNEVNKNKSHSINVVGLKNLIDISSNSTYIIQISSDYIFDGNSGPYLEEDHAYPINYYGKTKLEAENLLRGSLHRWTILRPNVIYSDNLFCSSNFFAWAYKALIKNEKINVVNDQVSNPTYLDHLVKCVFQCIIMSHEGILNVGSENFISRYDFVVEIAKTFNLDINNINSISTEKLFKKNKSYIARRPQNSGLYTDKIDIDLNVTTASSIFYLTLLKNKINYQ